MRRRPLVDFYIDNTHVCFTVVRALHRLQLNLYEVNYIFYNLNQTLPTKPKTIPTQTPITRPPTHTSRLVGCYLIDCREMWLPAALIDPLDK